MSAEKMHRAVCARGPWFHCLLCESECVCEKRIQLFAHASVKEWCNFGVTHISHGGNGAARFACVLGSAAARSPKVRVSDITNRWGFAMRWASWVEGEPSPNDRDNMRASRALMKIFINRVQVHCVFRSASIYNSAARARSLALCLCVSNCTDTRVRPMFAPSFPVLQFLMHFLQRPPRLAGWPTYARWLARSQKFLHHRDLSHGQMLLMQIYNECKIPAQMGWRDALHRGLIHLQC